MWNNWFTFIIFSWCISHLDCELYQDRPKIKTQDGDLILEPALNKNIYLRPNGPKSSIYVGEINIFQANTSTAGSPIQQGTNVNLDQYFNGTNGIYERLQNLENNGLSAPPNVLLNISALTLRVSRLHRRVFSLQNQVRDLAKDNCQSNPCQHGGTCLNIVNGYHCLCPSNWEGEDCDIDVNECRKFAGTDLGCQNGAVCINKPGTYECMCQSSWYGVHCTSKAKKCSGGEFEMCGHGTCIDVSSGEGIKCICHQGWTTNNTGPACLTDVNECESYQTPRCSVNPRVECINLPGSFRCGQCPHGYEGDGYSCYDIDECITLPNGGCSPLVACHNTIGSRICGACPPGYQGDGVTCTWRGTCSIQHGGCHPSAQCTEYPSPTGQTTQCTCPEGMEGNGIGLSGCYFTHSNATEGCQNNPCGEHGRCHQIRESYTCICFKGYGGAHCEAPVAACSVNPCSNGGTCRPDDTTEKGFRCECTAQYSGPLCQVRSRNCGGVINHEEGSIVYPLSNTTNNNNIQCAWVIHTVPDKVINVTFSKFNLEKSPGPECYNFLQIHDGRKSSSQLIGRFCGDTFPKGGNIISSSNNLYLWFHSDKSVGEGGFALHWTSPNPVCGGETNATNHGHISSPGSPGPYPANRDCYWHLTTTPGKRISLHFFALDIETHPNCSFDYLAIYDGEHATDPLIDKFCNSTQPAPVQSAGSEVFIHFHSDAYGSGNGFQIAYAPVDGVPGCGGYFTSEKGEISSPSYNGKYLSGLLCDYKIKTSAVTKVKIVFTQFKLERSFQCKYDSLSIYDGPSAESRLVGRFCGSTFPNTFTSSSNNLYFVFKTDHSLNSLGFTITYEAVCIKSITGDSGVITSPGYPFTYPLNRQCVYLIRTNPGKAIQLTFQDFDLEDNSYYNCRYDSVEIKDGPDENSTSLGRFCGGSEHIPPTQTSTHNYMYIKFKSDMSISGTGFYANFTTVDAECGGIHREMTGLINHPSGSDTTYKNNQNCIWLLIAPEGMHIQLTWNRFDIEEMPNCGSDYLELLEIDNDNIESEQGKFCGTKSPPALTTSTNRLKLIFKTDGSVRTGGFSLSYTFFDERTHCGGNYIKSHGNLYSPGWPKSYEPNRDCTWVITVPVGQQIALNISDFSIERPIRDSCNNGDYLEVRNGATTTSPLIGQYCGKFKWKRVVSMANTLHIHFHSDFYLTGSGFKIEWDGTLTGCGGTLTNAHGTLSSPNYPNNYDENAECFYKIVTSAGSRLRIHFLDLELEQNSRCRDDYVAIYDGLDTESPRLGRYCSMTPDLTDVVTSTNYAFIKFRSDVFLNAKGFLLNYNTVCNNNITGRYGVIESPNYPNNYPLRANCLWTIQVPKGNKINVTFTHFDVYKTFHFYRFRSNSIRNGNCDSDYLEFKEISDINYSTKFCGNNLPPMISTKSNTLQIKFATGDYVPHTGFRLEWVSYGCGGQINKESGTISVDSVLTSQKELECEWLIQSTPGESIIITFDEIYMAAAPNCTIDSIEIYNGQNTKSPLLFKTCGLSGKAPSSYQSDSNFILVRFNKTSNLKDVHFTSVFRSKKSNCGGRLNAISGFIYSKNYPKNYDNDLDCIWYITVPDSHRIEFNLMDFDLYSSFHYEDDACDDSIQIYDTKSYSASSNYTYKICPNSNLTQIVSKYNSIVVQFKTDSYGTAKGFKANYTIRCGAMITANKEGIIESDNFIRHANQTCIWTISAPEPNQAISLTLTHISLPKDYNVITNRNCPSSYLRIYDGNDNKAPVIDEFCGRKVPPTIVSRGSSITVEFGSYNNEIAGAFSASYSPLSNACGGTLTAEAGVIASPNYPGSYPPNVDCEWYISTSPGNKAAISVEKFQLEDSDRCNEDYLEIRKNDGAGPLLGVYCGHKTIENDTIASKLYIKFHSDNETNDAGFLLHYGLLHENDIEGESGEITSPMYPEPYHGAGEYSWRIFVAGSETVTLTIDHLEIPTYNGEGYNRLSFYDGFDETAPLLEQLNGIITEIKNIQSSSSAVFIKLTMDESNSGSLLHIDWAKSSESLPMEPSDRINCGENTTVLVSPGTRVSLKSPHYPNNYDHNSNCEWTYRSLVGRHLSVRFTDFKIEENPSCFTDWISIYSSNSPNTWRPVKEKTCLSSFVGTITNTSNYMKIKFISDSSISYKGFLAEINSECGGFISNLSGEVGPTYADINSQYLRTQYRHGKNKVICDWTVKVRPGRTIKLRFLNFNITDTTDNKCGTSVTLRNGDSEEAPFLANGKYCGHDHENRTGLITSSNSLFIRYVTDKPPRSGFKGFTIFYEEKNDECGLTSTLSPEHSWEIISSPSYPYVPLPYSECKWVFNAPPGEIVRIDFLGRFDLDYVDDCATEVVEIRDGSSGLSPLIGAGRYCREKPGTIKSTGNTLYIKYMTQLAEPRNGFKANVSLDVCGGTIVADSGELKSPGYPHMQSFREGTVCTWHIKSSQRYIYKIDTKDINLPHSVNYCATKITIEESVASENNELPTVTILKTLCPEDFDAEDSSVIESSRNEFVIKLHIGKSDSWDHFSNYKGFRILFDASRPTCGGIITTSEGYLTSPSYPQDTTIRYCQWMITVPDKSRKIRLELLDADKDKHRIGIYDDILFLNPIYLVTSSNSDSQNNVFYSTGNKITIFVWLNRTVTGHRFKAKFSSDEAALCGGELGGLNQALQTPVGDLHYNCEWHYDSQALSESATSYKSVFVTVETNSSELRTHCRYSDPKIALKSRIGNLYLSYRREVCGNTEVSYRFPSSVLDVTATKNKNESFNFNVRLRAQPCGGIVNVGEDPVNILNLPVSYNDTLECSWVIVSPAGRRLKISMTGTFELGCDDQYLIIKQSPSQLAQLTGQYCKEKKLDNPLVTHISRVYIEYHTLGNTNTSLKLFAQTTSQPCGGLLQWYQYSFESPNYPKTYLPNQECTWDIRAEKGYRVSLNFVDRFVIEDKPNCTKDMVIIYDYIDNTYVEMARICGRQVPAPFNSTLNRMKVVFRTDNEINLDGFKATWRQICGGKYLATETEQFLYSPGYPYAYSPLLDCSYKISANNSKVLVKFIEFQLEGTPPDCSNDNLTIISDDYYGDNNAVYCGSDLPPILTKYQEVSLLFKTDRSVGRKGFKLAYSIFKCGGKVNDSTVLTSSTAVYNENMNCTWLIEAPSNKIVALKFLYIDIESHTTCNYDYLALYDGLSVDENKRFALLCGHKNNSIFRSKSNSMVLQFVTDSSINYAGFKAEVYFSYSTSVGCGGKIDLTSSNSYDLTSPYIGSSIVYENFLDCEWSVLSPTNSVVKISFISFHISPCAGVNQTALGYSQCDCDFVEIKDGLNPNSLVIGTYCGHTLPPQLVSSANTMSIRLSTDGELDSAGFTARLTVQTPPCGPSVLTVGQTPTRLRSPSYERGLVPRGIHCAYRIESSDTYSMIRLTIVNLDLQNPSYEGSTNVCNKDKLIISKNRYYHNTSLGKDYVVNHDTDDFFSRIYVIDGTFNYPDTFALCGQKESIDYYLYGNAVINLMTSAESDGKTHKGVEIEVAFVGYCGRNYSETRGRIQSTYDYGNANEPNDCYTLITAPENYTISVYFFFTAPVYYDDECYLDIFDGNKTSSPRLIKIKKEYNDYPIFSTGRYLLLHNHQNINDRVTYDLNYVTTDKGRGCGGKLSNEMGKVTSPMYPKVYRQVSTCEWELETPFGTHLYLHFSVFDLGSTCDQNYLQLIDSKGVVVRSFCSNDLPADYTSQDNFLKLVLFTTKNNGGSGWVADYIGIV